MIVNFLATFIMSFKNVIVYEIFTSVTLHTQFTCKLHINFMGKFPFQAFVHSAGVRKFQK